MNRDNWNFNHIYHTFVCERSLKPAENVVNLLSWSIAVSLLTIGTVLYSRKYWREFYLPVLQKNVAKLILAVFNLAVCRVNVIISPLVCSHYTFHDICPSPRLFVSVHLHFFARKSEFICKIYDLWWTNWRATSFKQRCLVNLWSIFAHVDNAINGLAMCKQYIGGFKFGSLLPNPPICQILFPANIFQLYSMSILQYFRLKNGLPDPKGSLSASICSEQ